MWQASDIEFEPVERWQALTVGRLAQQVAYCYDRSPFYRKKLDACGIRPEQICDADDLRRLPLTTKNEVDACSGELLCVPEREIVDICQTSGTTGQPVSFMQTAADLERLGYNEEISFRAAGMTDADRVMIACSLGRCFMAGLAYFEGVRRVGAMAIRAGSGQPAVLAQAALHHRPSILIAVPSQALALGQNLLRLGHDPAALGVRQIICIGEPVREPDLSLSCLGQRLASMWNGQVTGTYASTEMATSFTDCTEGRGGHFHPELIAVELVDEQGDPVAPGTAGEVVATPLGVTGMPLLRYATGDIAVCHVEPCSCGRTSYRLGPILGRKQQKMKIRGTSVYPGSIISVLQQIEAVRYYCLEVYDDYELSETVRVVVGVDDPRMVDPEAVADQIRAHIRVKPQVAVRPAEEVCGRVYQEGKRKPVTFFDFRQRRDGQTGAQ